VKTLNLTKTNQAGEAESFFTSWLSLRYSLNSKPYIQPENSLPCSQEPAATSYAERDQSSPHTIALILSEYYSHTQRKEVLRDWRKLRKTSVGTAGRYPGRDFNPRPAEYEAGVLTARLWHSVTLVHTDKQRHCPFLHTSIQRDGPLKRLAPTFLTFTQGAVRHAQVSLQYSDTYNPWQGRSCISTRTTTLFSLSLSLSISITLLFTSSGKNLLSKRIQISLRIFFVSMQSMLK
jgi:hypothetical protein